MCSKELNKRESNLIHVTLPAVFTPPSLFTLSFPVCFCPLLRLPAARLFRQEMWFCIGTMCVQVTCLLNILCKHKQFIWRGCLSEKLMTHQNHGRLFLIRAQRWFPPNHFDHFGSPFNVAPPNLPFFLLVFCFVGLLVIVSHCWLWIKLVYVSTVDCNWPVLCEYFAHQIL